MFLIEGLIFFESRYPEMIMNTANPHKKNKLLGRATAMAIPEPIKTLPHVQRKLFKY